MEKPKSEDYRLRALNESDLEQVLEWRNSERIRTNMYTDHIISIEEHREWFKKISLDNNAVYKVFEFKGRSLGVVNATQIDRVNQKCSWAFYLGDENVPFGSGAVMEFLFLEYVFEELKIRKLCCEVFVFNLTTIKLHKKFGFREEGYFKQHILKNNTYEDVISMALLVDEWIITKPKLEKLCFSQK
ncbi:UDP-4-amino-4,6-dideoxy-N-acetyl-beta-L-altrosamine N-acetyltransferase [Calothrix sp. PCC 7507]|uniref:UDP-4-amino-4, 6-dideoxy-N-acetyl-beta-L-altrosamine N-acetyltransferase n=1 Tax=Calothrix sp. PCC 7507 TaxID=99598 RepID=UPI00029ECEA3|nr:UDP-4-amino-4,6-dideoxy-N-acetyl-beta-L-altrosamine N-acetyltransferase [Calothrix sp. PCC 7507]AFY35676.1 pseudaminic acid biosynthesis N-acetyl transferase [Calothrix sp. PCC 7507]